EILNLIDDHSRFLVASRAFVTAKAADVVETFHQGASELGLPVSMLTDNGAIFTAESRRGACAIEFELIALGIDYKHSRPYHPQTCGKVERFHQTLKRWLANQHRDATIAGLQAQLDRFRTYYNTIRPHRALGRRTPAEAFAARTKATPRKPGITVPTGHRVRRDRIDSGGKVTLRYRSKLLHLGVGRRYRGTRVMLLIAERDVRVINDDGELLAEFTIDPNKTYQTQKRPGQRA
ncbi:MAG: integrase core domain-containing protein, partial [Jiangellaceae bacterium]